MNKRLLHTTIFSIALVLLLSACSFFFSNEDLGLSKQLTIYLGDRDSSRAVYDLPGELPTFSKVIIRINGEEKDYTRGSDNSYNVPIPEENDYTVDIKALVDHSGNDLFPFIKSLGGSAKGPFPNNLAAIPLSLRETGIVLLGQPSGNQSPLFSYIDLPGGTPKNVTNLRIKSDNIIPSFDFDPYGNLFIWNYVNGKFQLTKVNDKNEAITGISENQPYGIGYDRKGGRIYYTTKSLGIIITLYSVDSTGTRQKQWTDTGDLFEFFSDLQFVSTHNNGNDTFIYIGVDTGVLVKDVPTILKYKQDGTSIGSVELDTKAHLRDLRVIDNYLYAIVESTNNTSSIRAIDANAPVTAEKIDISKAKTTADAGTHYFQRIVGWDDDSLYVLESGTGVHRITKLSRDLENPTTVLNLD
ncbi:hypothetical protein [Treponema primitia]|uniref:hypothetical protein n=1 Tax=Treponema primitia TaxID=88058 RepID=UPI0002555692|nr:hypothetical protein [Treponema primitia]